MVLRRPSVILIDNAHLLDSESWAVLAAVHGTTSVPLVVARNERPSGSSPDRSVRSLASASIMVRLKPLTFGATTELLLNRLGDPASLDVLTRVYRKSGGLPSLIVAIIDVAKLSGRLTLLDGVWTMSGKFWDDNLSGVIEHLLGDVTRPQMDLIEAIGILGAVDLETAIELVGEEELETLEAAKIVAVVSTGSRPSVVLDPPLIGEWVRHGSPSVRRRRVEATLRERVPEALHSQAPSALSRALSMANPALGGAVDHERVNRLEAAREAWDQNPSFASGVAYLDELQSTPTDPDAIENLYAALEDAGGAPCDRARFRRLRMNWLAFRLGRTQDALALAFKLDPDLEPYSEYLEAIAVRIAVEIDGVPADIEERLAQLRRPRTVETGWGTVAEAYVRLVQGRAISALELLSNLQPEPGSELSSFSDVVRMWSRMSSGDIKGAFEESTEYLNDSLSRLDLRMTREYALIAVSCLLAIGQYGVGCSLMEAVLTLGVPAVGQERTQAGLLSYAAVFNALSGKLPLAESLTLEAERANLPPGPLSGANAGSARAAMHNLTGDRASAITSMVALFEQLRSRGYLLSAVDGGMVGGLMFGMSELLPEIAPLLNLLEGEWRVRYLAYIHALSAEDTEAIESCAEQLIREGRLAAAHYAATELRRLYSAAQDPAGVARSERLFARVTDLRDEIDVAAAGWLYGKHYEVVADLTVRERELVYLALRGHSNKQIAEQLHLSLRTVETHLSAAYQKLGVRNRVGLLELQWDWQESI
ncbi:hypothetical protein G7068_04345 [Leucobacter viscericola]|uniref:HTH luxR-type domain-containing protein n=1 Tax=Leucobacter viscericola TaxID=2714935 RepID=A0A6G7XD89_9MICO|nr:LuxR family transcriptional regulator [Leucobacter viscericola]QIK62525.1 hypothetical protein G7068_04345 [Leucobacter viscericola]